MAMPRYFRIIFVSSKFVQEQSWLETKVPVPEGVAVEPRLRSCSITSSARASSVGGMLRPEGIKFFATTKTPRSSVSRAIFCAKHDVACYERSVRDKTPAILRVAGEV